MVKFLVVGDPHGSEKVFDITINNLDYILIPRDIGKADLIWIVYYTLNKLVILSF